VTRARRTDQNHAAIVKALRQCGWLVLDTHTLPNGVDAIAYRPGDYPGGCFRMLEFKKPDGKLRLTDSQRELLNQGWPIHILRSVDDAIALR
jgi:hypothetical protein